MHIWLRLHTAEVSFMHAYVPHEQPMPIKDMSIGGGSQCLEVAGAEHVVALQYWFPCGTPVASGVWGGPFFSH